MIQSSGRMLLLSAFLSLALIGGIWERWERQIYGVHPGVQLEEIDVGCYLPHELMPILEEVAAREQSLPIEPRIDKGNIIAGKPGITVDVEATLEALLDAEPDEQVALRRLITQPRHRVDEIRGLNTPLGQFSTTFHSDPGRGSNIRLACQAIDYQVQWPGKIFSFNKTVGPRTGSYGYHMAPVMLDEELIPGVGGGVCQVATTLYNAARLSKLPIKERHRHSGKVSYVSKGLDAAVAYDYLDLKFTNNRSYPLVIRCYTRGNRITAMILGRDSGKGEN